MENNNKPLETTQKTLNGNGERDLIIPIHLHWWWKKQNRTSVACRWINCFRSLLMIRFAAVGASTTANPICWHQPHVENCSGSEWFFYALIFARLSLQIVAEHCSWNYYRWDTCSVYAVWIPIRIECVCFAFLFTSIFSRLVRLLCF